MKKNRQDGYRTDVSKLLCKENMASRGGAAQVCRYGGDEGAAGRFCRVLRRR